MKFCDKTVGQVVECHFSCAESAPTSHVDVPKFLIACESLDSIQSWQRSSECYANGAPHLKPKLEEIKLQQWGRQGWADQVIDIVEAERKSIRWTFSDSRWEVSCSACRPQSTAAG